MAWNNDTTSASEDDLDSKASPNSLPTGSKDPLIGIKIKVKNAPKGFSKGIGTRKSTSAPRGAGKKGTTTKANSLKNA